MTSPTTSGLTPDKLFKYFDINHENAIPKNDIPKVLNALGVIKTQKDFFFLLKTLPDKVSREEYDEMIKLESQTSVDKQQLIAAFEVFDEMKTGKCPFKDVAHSLSVVGDKWSKEQIEHLRSISNIDSNGFLEYKSLINNWMINK